MHETHIDKIADLVRAEALEILRESDTHLPAVRSVHARVVYRLGLREGHYGPKSQYTPWKGYEQDCAEMEALILQVFEPYAEAVYARRAQLEADNEPDPTEAYYESLAIGEFHEMAYGRADD